MKVCAKLQYLGGDKKESGMKIKTAKEYKFSLKPGQDTRIAVQVKAPKIPGIYHALYQLDTKDGVRVAKRLELFCDVQPEVQAQFNAAKERKIELMMQLEAYDRKQVVAALQKNKWNVQQSVDSLIGSSSQSNVYSFDFYSQIL